MGYIPLTYYFFKSSIFAVQVKVIFAGGLCDQDFIIYTLEKTVRDGHWLVFNNCHLMEHWDAKLVARFNQLFSPFGGKSVTSDNGNWISVTAIKQSGTEKRQYASHEQGNDVLPEKEKKDHKPA